MASRKMSKSKATGGEKRLNEIFEDAIRSQEEAHDSGQELKKDYIENVDKVKFEASGRPSKAMLALIDRYKCTSQKDLVYNTIDQVIQENIYKIQQAVSNMIKYGDTKVFKVLPKELDAEMRDYGMAAQEYFGKKVAELNNLPVYIIPVTYKRCNKCKQYKSEDDYYSTQGDVFDGKFPICKDCTKILFKEYLRKYKDIKEVLVLMSQKFDLYLYEPTLKRMVTYADSIEGKKELTEGTFFANYLSNLYLDIELGGVEINEPNFSKSYLGGIPFKFF